MKELSFYDFIVHYIDNCTDDRLLELLEMQYTKLKAKLLQRKPWGIRIDDFYNAPNSKGHAFLTKEYRKYKRSDIQ